jgi:excisionase family DNA binding protein
MTTVYTLDGLLTVPEVAARLKVKVRTVRDWVYKRRIPFTRFQRRIYIAAGVVEELLTRNAVAALPGNSSPGLTPTGQGGAGKGIP